MASTISDVKNCIKIQSFRWVLKKMEILRNELKRRSNMHIIMASAAVAQLDRVLGYEPRGRGFDSCQPHQNDKPQNFSVLRLFRFHNPNCLLRNGFAFAFAFA